MSEIYIPSQQFYIEQLSDQFGIEVDILKDAIHQAALTRPTGEDKSLKAFNALENDTDFANKIKSIFPALDHQQKINLRWLINRAYFTGYKDGGIDGN